MFERRSSWAQLLRALHAASAKVLAIDAMFADPERLLDEGLQADIDTFLQSAPPAGDGAVGLLRRVQAALHGDEELERALEEAGEAGLIHHAVGGAGTGAGGGAAEHVPDADDAGGGAVRRDG